MTQDFADIQGHSKAIDALELAAAGGHHILLRGEPGCGKTMLARRLVSILPELPAEERHPWVSTLPFRAPHHTVSAMALEGDARGPGEFTLARGGVLFLDEISEFRSSALESILRIGRTRQVQLVFADTVPVSPRQQAIQASLTQIVDICVDLDPPKFHGPFQCNRTSADIKQRVGAARAFRQKHTPGILVAAMDYRDLAPNFSVGALALIRQNYGSGDRIDDSPRALRLMRVARTAADLEQAKEVTTRHVCRALLFTV